MTVSLEHENGKHVLGLLVAALAGELGIDMMGGGSTTCRQEELKRGFEPDECYWIAHEKAMRGRARFDPTSDPPPDLAIEVEISHSTMDRISLYASLGVPELWRWNGKRLTIGLLDPDGQYHESQASLAFPFLPVAEFVRFLTMRGPSETQIINQFRQWVREPAGRRLAGEEDQKERRQQHIARTKPVEIGSIRRGRLHPLDGSGCGPRAVRRKTDEATAFRLTSAPADPENDPRDP